MFTLPVILVYLKLKTNSNVPQNAHTFVFPLFSRVSSFAKQKTPLTPPCQTSFVPKKLSLSLLLEAKDNFNVPSNAYAFVFPVFSRVYSSAKQKKSPTPLLRKFFFPKGCFFNEYLKLKTDFDESQNAHAFVFGKN